MEFRHFSHHHPLTLKEKTEDLQIPAKCQECKEVCVGPTYSCNECSDFFLHKPCAMLPIKGQDEGQDHHLHFSHSHPLAMKENHAANCSVCGEFSHGAFYICEPCQFYLHQSCSHLLQEELRYFRQPHSLTHHHSYTFRSSQGTISDECKACGDEITSNYYYDCTNVDEWVFTIFTRCDWEGKCKFKMHISCALLFSKMESEGLQLFYHPWHDHPLTLGNINRDDEINCTICNRRCSGQTYVCCSSKCRSFSLHQSCFDLPVAIRHQIHRHHPLLLVGYPVECFVCSVKCVGIPYLCPDCRILLDVVCLTKISIIKYQGHEHNLFFSPNWNLSMPNSCCRACGTEPQISSPINSPAFRCLECDFFLHLKCGPLPCAIEHDDHNLHPLTLTDSPVVAENEDRDGTTADQFVCDACEKVDRDPRLPVYYCHEGCHYLAEFECVIPEVIRSLMGEHGEVELKTPIRQVPGMVVGPAIFEAITDMAQAYKHDHQIDPVSTFSHTLDWIRKSELEKVILASEKDMHQDSCEVFSLIMNAAKTQFRELLNRVGNQEYSEPWNKEKVVSVGDHRVPLSLAPFVEDLCAKYGDIGAESALTRSELKTYFIVMLCATIQSMYATRVVDISEDCLANWWVNLKILQFAGFKVQFAFDHLNSVMYAYNGIRIEYEEKRKRENLRCEIKEISLTIEQLKAELATKTVELATNTAELATKTNMLEALASEPEFTGFKGDCLRKASALRWKVAGEGIL